MKIVPRGDTNSLNSFVLKCTEKSLKLVGNREDVLKIVVSLTSTKYLTKISDTIKFAHIMSEANICTLPVLALGLCQVFSIDSARTTCNIQSIKGCCCHELGPSFNGRAEGEGQIARLPKGT
jgi:hypothetical protein